MIFLLVCSTWVPSLISSQFLNFFSSENRIKSSTSAFPHEKLRIENYFILFHLWMDAFNPIISSRVFPHTEKVRAEFSFCLMKHSIVKVLLNPLRQEFSAAKGPTPPHNLLLRGENAFHIRFSHVFGFQFYLWPIWPLVAFENAWKDYAWSRFMALPRKGVEIGKFNISLFSDFSEFKINLSKIIFEMMFL